MRWSIASIAAVVVPALAVAQQPTYGRDTARAHGHDKGRDQVRAESRGAVDVPGRRPRGRTTWGLSSSQISELQQALQRIDCYDAEIDGRIGPRTRAGIACAKRHHNITGEDPNELTRALGLSFQVDAKAGLGAVMRSGSRRDQRGPRPNRQDNARDTLPGKRPTTTPSPQNVPPR
jgi:peptidoglycan hydrolase-like protein with peptidoglycan-binding domain